MRAQVWVVFLGVAIGLAPEASFCLDEDEAASAEAVRKTSELLRSRARREGYAATDQHAASVVDGAKSLVGADPAREQELFDQAASIFEKLAAGAKNDPAKLQEIMAELQKNPRALESRMTEDQKRRLRDLASKVSEQQNAPAKPR